jgi:hypothetical protein
MNAIAGKRGRIEAPDSESDLGSSMKETGRRDKRRRGKNFGKK